ERARRQRRCGDDRVRAAQPRRSRRRIARDVPRAAPGRPARHPRVRAAAAWCVDAGLSLLPESSDACRGRSPQRRRGIGVPLPGGNGRGLPPAGSAHAATRTFGLYGHDGAADLRHRRAPRRGPAALITVSSLWSAPNLLSFSRIVAAPILYLLIVSGGRYGYLAAAVLFVVASFTDTLDGEMARRSRLVSRFGIYLDTTADKILIAVLLVALAVVHLAPGWMAAVIIAREFLVTGLRSYAAALGVVIPAGGWGKAKTLITIVALFLVLLEGDARQGGLLSAQAGPGSV